MNFELVSLAAVLSGHGQGEAIAWLHDIRRLAAIVLTGRCWPAEVSE